ncbi:hypothetical protein DITRI_Ditri05aG0141700 [Diplodiscus trichospermus]
MIEKTKRQKKGSISEEDISNILHRYTATTVLALLQEVAQYPGVKLNWDALVKKTSTGISNAREYQMLWRHLAYHDALLEKLEDGAEPLDDDSDLEYELEPCPSVSSEASAEATACVKVLIASGLPSDSSNGSSSMVEAPLTINIPNAHSFGVSSENLQPTCSMRGMNITVPVSVQKQIQPAVTSAEALEGNGSAGPNLPARRKRKKWSEAEDKELLAAVKKCGAGNWANILRGDFKGDRSASQLAQRWTIIRKRLDNLNAGKNSTIPQLSEAQLATRCALSLALDMPDKNLTAACTNNPGMKTISNNQTLAATSDEASVQAQSQFQEGPISSVQAQNHSQQGPLTSVSVHNQPQKGPTNSVPAHNPTQKGPITSVPIQNQSQQGPVASVKVPNQLQCPATTKTSPRGSSRSTQSQQGPVASVKVPNQPQQCPTTAKTSPRGSSGSIQSQQGPVASVKVPNQPQQCTTTAKTSSRGSSGSNPSQQGPVASVKVPNQPQQCTMATKTSPRGSSGSNQSQQGPVALTNQSQQGPVASVKVPNQPQQCPMTTKTSPRGSSGSNQSQQGPVASVKVPNQPQQCTMTTKTSPRGSLGSNQSQQGPVASVKVPNQAQQCPMTTKTAPRGSSGSNQSQQGPVASVKVPNQPQQCSMTTKTSPRGSSGSVADSLPKNHVQENGACVSKNEQGVKDNKAPAPNPEFGLKTLDAVAEHSNEKLMVEDDQVEVKANLVEQSKTANDNMIDFSLIKSSENQAAAEGSCRNQNMIGTPAEACLNDGCTKHLEVLSTSETGQAA